MTQKAKRTALYLRVSTGEQTTENQRSALTEEAERRGWRIVCEYEDAGISGAKGRAKRPGLDSMIRDATKGKFDVLMCWSLDRLGRSLASLIDTAHELQAASVDLFVLRQSIDTTSPAGRMFFHIVGAFAEYERELIRERVVAGIRRAQAKGKRCGRPPLKADVVERASGLLKAGMGMDRVARQLHIGKSQVQRIKHSLTPANDTAPDSLAV